LKASRSSLAKAPRFFLSIKRLLSQKSDCSCILDLLCSLYRFQGSLRLSDLLAQRKMYYSKYPPLCQPLFSIFLYFFVFTTYGISWQNISATYCVSSSPRESIPLFLHC